MLSIVYKIVIVTRVEVIIIGGVTNIIFIIFSGGTVMKTIITV